MMIHSRGFLVNFYDPSRVLYFQTAGIDSFDNRVGGMLPVTLRPYLYGLRRETHEKADDTGRVHYGGVYPGGDRRILCRRSTVASTRRQPLERQTICGPEA